MLTTQFGINDTVEVFIKFMMPRLANVDKFDTTGRAALVEKIIYHRNRELPLDFVMLGLPFKSTNQRDKVLGVKPDFGEELMMKNLRRFSDAIKEVYEPGIKVTVASDGLVFNDLLKVDESIVLDYKEISLDMAKSINAPVEILDLNDFYFKGNSRQSKEKLLEQFGITEEMVRVRILSNPDVNMLYNGMIIFMREEQAPIDFVSGNQRQKAAKRLAMDMMLMNEAYSTLVASQFKSSIRLSMHPSENSGNKFSFQLIEGKPENIWASPWHSVIVLDPIEGAITMHKKDAVLHGYDLVTKDNQPYYFIGNN